MSEQTAEQAAFRAQLVREYGELTVARGNDLAGITTCLLALGTDELSPAEREEVYHRAAQHLQSLIGGALPASEIARITQCAGRIDAAVDVWVADNIEAREGLSVGALSGRQNVGCSAPLAENDSEKPPR